MRVALSYNLTVCGCQVTILYTLLGAQWQCGIFGQQYYWLVVTDHYALDTVQTSVD